MIFPENSAFLLRVINCLTDFKFFTVITLNQRILCISESDLESNTYPLLLSVSISPVSTIARTFLCNPLNIFYQQSRKKSPSYREFSLSSQFLFPHFTYIQFFDFYTFKRHLYLSSSRSIQSLIRNSIFLESLVHNILIPIS